MSTQRGAIGYRFTGNGQCRWCGSPPPKPRRTWCSEACLEQFQIRSWPAFARQKVEERDHGVCALCGRDCEALEKRILARMAPVYWNDPVARLLAHRWANLLGRLGITSGGYYSIRSLWEADHILPVVEGGGGCGLENLRTLCRCCHRAETRALARRRAVARRAAAAAAAPQQSLPLEGR